MKELLNQFIALLDLRTVISYLTVGMITAIIYFSLFGFLYGGLHVDYRIAVTICYSLSVLIHFTANRHFTFKKYGPRCLKHILKYAFTVSINYLITLSIMTWVVQILLLPPYFGVLLAIAATVGTGYLTAKFWVFK